MNDNLIKRSTWRNDVVTGRSDSEVERIEQPAGKKVKMSFSGHERNKLFVKMNEMFEDLSGISGLDTELDTRNIAVFDYNRDGYQDFLVTNVSGQALNVYRNRIGELVTEPRYFVAVRFVGGNRNSRPSSKFSNRDAIGARAIVRAGDMRIERELRCGEGFAAQNSNTLIIGMGANNKAASVDVVWPTAMTSTVKDVPSGTLITFYEDKSEADNRRGYSLGPYEPVKEKSTNRVVDKIQFPLHDAIQKTESPLVVITSMATWCSTCRSHLPVIARIKEVLGDDVAIFAIPIDENDSPQKLKSYIENLHPAYEFLDLERSQVVQFQEFIDQQTGSTTLPSSVIINSDGSVLATLKGLPTVSDLVRLKPDSFTKTNSINAKSTSQ